MDTEKIIEALQNCRKTGENTYQAFCPAHDDRKASLTITDAGDRILMYCHAGCSLQDILNKLGLEEKDLFKNVPNKTKLEAEYIYTDANSNPLYKVMRFEPKNFVQAKYDKGNWIFKMTGVDYVLYNLPNIVKSDIVYFVEGEKDADNLNKIGLVSTTTVGGASAFKKRANEYVKALKDKIVYILPDNDKPGYKYAEDIKDALTGVAKEIKILKLSNSIRNLKEKADISDVLKEYGKEKTLEILQELINNYKEYIHIGDNSKLTLETFQDILQNLDIKIKYNELKDEIAIYNYPKELSPSNILNTFPIYITDYINKIGIKCTTQKVQNFISVLADMNSYNPVKEFLNSVVWDKKDRLSELYNIMGLSNENYKKYVYKWLLQCMALLNNNLILNYSADGVLVLQGKQGIGKTSFFRKLSINEEFFTEGVSLNTENKDDLINCTSSWICELGELDYTLKKNQSLLKGIITRSVDKIRYPFAKNVTTKSRKTSFCGTVNESRFIRDLTGSRRFWIIELDENYSNKKIQELSREWILQLWKQIEYIWENSDKKTCYRLSPNEIQQLETDNKKYNLLCIGEQEIEDSLDFSIPKNKYKHFTVTEIKEYLGLKNIDSGRLGRTLKVLSEKYPEYITPGRKGNSKIYNIPLKENSSVK